MSDDLEKEIALYEAERNRAWHSWFANRGDVSPSDEHTRIFDGGFRMAWELWRAQPAPQPVDQESAPDVAALVDALERFVEAWTDCQQQPVHAEEFEILTDICEDSLKALAAHRKQEEAER